MKIIVLTGLLAGVLLILSSCTPPVKDTTNYYFDASAGNDSNVGTSTEIAFKSLKKIKDLKLKPGDSILLKSAVVFEEQLYISCKGEKGKPIVVGKYGGAAKPVVKTNGSVNEAVHVYNSEHIVLRDLEISNKGENPIDGLNGILVELKNYGTAKNVMLDNLYVHDVLGGLIKDKKGGGNAILCRNFADEKTDTILSRFDSLIIQNCYIKDCQRNGIIMWGNWIRKSWNPSLHVIIRHNLIDGVPGDGIVPIGCESPLVEYNVMKNSPLTLPSSEACDGIWPWSCDNAVIQYNIVSDHKSQVDGYGFDSDWNCTNSLFQYNLSFNNDGGFLLICNSGGWPLDWSIGNVGTIIRYNVSINDGLRDYKVPGSKKTYFSPVIHITGPTQNTRIERNLFYVYKKSKPEIDRTIMSLTDWQGYADSTFFANNYIFVEEPNVAIDPTKSTDNFYENNLFIGDLKTPESGFSKQEGKFDKKFWYDEKDENWKKLLDFLKDKTIPVNGQEHNVLDIIEGKLRQN